MQHFRTPVKLPETEFSLDHQSAIFSMGSCFAEHISIQLKRLKFNCLLNPFGILYNPISILDALEWIIKEPSFTADHLFEHQGMWHSFFHHGSFSGSSSSHVLKNINASIHQARQFLTQTQYFICTLGTAYVFEKRDTKKIVANCHKLPNTDFKRRKLEAPEILRALEKSIDLLRVNNKSLKVILTVSPVRHIRDGLVENQRSKAALIMAVEAICENYENVEYFPAYEIMMDDLRDYRFYKADMIHPNEQAIDYIWKAFSSHYFEPSTIALNARIEKLVQAARHRPIHPQSSAHQTFIKEHLEKINQFTRQHPNISFEEEQSLLKQSLI